MQSISISISISMRVRHKMRMRRLFSSGGVTSSPSPSPRPVATTRQNRSDNTKTKTKTINRLELYRVLSGVGSSGQTVSGVLSEITSVKGLSVLNEDLVFCLKNLRKYSRYHHCLQILDWMENNSPDFSVHALRLDLISRLNGISDAESYFHGLPPASKKPFLYGTLLNCYCANTLPLKALDLFRKMDDMNWLNNSLPFDNLMSLYIKLRQPHKVFPLVQEMKDRSILLSPVSYHIWLQSLGHLKDLAGVERVMDEVQSHSFINTDWKIYSCLATIYIQVGQPQRAASALTKLHEVLVHQRVFDRTAYHHLISSYAKIRAQDSVFHAWKNLNSDFPDCHNLSYLVMLQALSKLANIDALKKILEEWESRHKSYDARLPSVAIHAYLKHGMLQDAELLFKDTVSRKGGQKLWYAHVCFMDYYLGKHQIDSALRHMEAAYSDGWKLSPEKLRPFFDYFKQEKDVHACEKLCNMLKDVQALDATAYLWLLQTYVAAGKEPKGMRQRMEEDGVNISSEHDELLSGIGQI